MRDGERLAPAPSLADANARFRADLERVPETARRIADPEPVWSRDSDALRELTERAKTDALAKAGVRS
jgi:hypothetical protein